jgi:hypothetical protein
LRLLVVDGEMMDNTMSSAEGFATNRRLAARSAAARSATRNQARGWLC